MAARVDVGIDAQRDARRRPLRLGELVEAVQLARRFDVDRLEAERDRPRQLVGALADAGEHDLTGVKAAAQRDIDFAHRVGVDAAPRSLSSLTISSDELALSA